MAAKPFESRIQDLVYNVDVGIGARLIKGTLYVLFISFIILLYTANQFRGLRDAEAMDYAQLGRNFMEHRQLITQNVRPASIWYLTRSPDETDPRIHGHPDIVHAPLYPVMLGTWFRIPGMQFDALPDGPLNIYQPERRIMYLNHLFAIFTGLLLYLVGRRLFDARVALLGVTIYFLSDMVWRDSLSGTGVTIAAFWAIAAVYAMLIAVSRIEESADTRRWMVPALVSLAFCVLAFLTRYAAVALVPGLALYLGLALKQRGWVWGPVFIALFLVAVSPWFARNIAVSGAPLGLAPHMALNDTTLFAENSFERSLNPNLEGQGVAGVLQTKSLKNFHRFYQENLRTIGEGLLICIFFTTFFYRFVRSPVHTLRWCLALSIALFLLIASFYGDATFRLIVMFWPFIILYALAFFFLLLERMQLQVKIMNMAVTGALIILSALPMIFTLLPPRATIPYPPYAPQMIMYVSNLLRPNELMCTDMSWATAWYGRQTSVLLPYNIEEFYDINDYMHRFSGLYFTNLTRNQPYARTLRSSRYVTWLPILEGRIPGDFPLTQGIPLRDMENIFLSDRARWAEEAP